LTRAEVRAQLIQLEKAGYNPATANDTNYPQDLQAAERRVEAQQQAQAVAQAPAAKPAAAAADTGYGAATSGSSQAGAPTQLNNQPGSVYFGH
jgi:type IV secretory pathway VirB9-like protein